MRERIILGVVVALATLDPTAGTAATLSFYFEARPTTPQEIQDGAPPHALVHNYFVTSSADILRIGDVHIRAPQSEPPNTVYNHPLGSDTAPPPPPFFLTDAPPLGADSWITTPGNDTSTAGGGLGDDNASWFDTSNNGPVTHFNFARLTTASVLEFRGVISVAGENGPEVFPFVFGILPEPTSVLLLWCGLLCGALGSRRHLLFGAQIRPSCVR